MKALELTGNKFGRLTVVKKIGGTKYGNVSWECLCDCGNTTIVTGSHLNSNHTTSCGCYQRQRASEASLQHGHSLNGVMSPTYGSWSHMKTRCNNPNYPFFENYGGRGITYCERWSKFDNFLEDMGERPKGRYSLERIDNEGNYEPSNCKWIPLGNQAYNTTRSANLTYKGKTKCMAEWAKILNVSYWKIKYRRKKGVPFNEIVAELSGVK